MPANNTVTQDTGTLFQFFNPGSLAGDATLVGAGVRELLAQTAQEAANSSKQPARFATAVMDASSSVPQALYSLAQCTPDLSAGDCLACLRWIIGKINDTASVRNGERILVLRCNVRFETFLFYDGAPMKRITSSSSPPAPPVPAPATNTSMTDMNALAGREERELTVTVCSLSIGDWRCNIEDREKINKREREMEN